MLSIWLVMTVPIGVLVLATLPSNTSAEPPLPDPPRPGFAALLNCGVLGPSAGSAHAATMSIPSRDAVRATDRMPRVMLVGLRCESVVLNETEFRNVQSIGGLR